MTNFLNIILWWCVILSIFQSLKNSYSYTIVKNDNSVDEINCSNGSEFQKECDCSTIITNGNNNTVEIYSNRIIRFSQSKSTADKCFEFCENCPSNIQDDDRKKCEDKMPTCKEFANPAVCCSMKQVMNYSCEKTCKFCTDVSEGIPGMPLPITPLPGQPTMTTVQDPCNLGPPQPAPPGGGGGGQPGGIPNPPAGIPGQG